MKIIISSRSLRTIWALSLIGVCVLGLVFLTPKANTGDLFAPAVGNSVAARYSSPNKYEPNTVSVTLPASKPVAIEGVDIRNTLLAYNSTINGRAFAIDSWSKPGSGGQFYASVLIDKCAAAYLNGLLSQVQPDINLVGEKNYLQALSAITMLQGRCGQLTSEDFQKYSSSVLIDSTNTDRDILMNVVSKFRNSVLAGNRINRESAIKEIFELGDPMVIEDIGIRLSLYSDKAGAYLYFDGEKFPLKNEPAIAAAFYLLPCAMGLACDSRDPDLQVRCITGAGCFANRYERVAKEMSGEDGRKSAEIFAFYGALASAARAAEFSKFIPPH